MKEEKIELAGLRFSSNRVYGGEGDLQILAEDIKQNGLINPITVKAIPEEVDAGQTTIVYEVSAGRRRVQAVTLLGWKDIPARVLEGDEADRAEEIALSENVNRLTMHPLDEAVYFKRLLENGEPIQHIAGRCDRKVSEIYQRVRLLSLEPALQELFRIGKISLVAAAMLADLDAGQQAFFIEGSVEIHIQDRKISDWTVRNFIAHLYHDKLYGFIADKECAGCKKRTFYTDKTLFPETDDEQDSCLDHECYLAKWRKTLEKAIKAAAKETPELAGARLLVTNDSHIKKIFGNTVALGQDEYLIKPWSWENKADKPGKDTAAALYAAINNKLEIELVHWREKPKESRSANSGFKPALKLLKLPKEEEKAAVEALRGKKLSVYDLNSKVKDRVFWRLMETKAALPGEAHSQKDIEFFISNFVLKSRYGGELNMGQKKIFELFMGYAYDGDAGKALLHAPWEKLFVLMTALNMNAYNIPDIDNFEAGKDKKHLGWFPVSGEEARKIYQEEIRALLPKPKAKSKPVSAEKQQRKTKGKQRSGKDQ